MNKAANVTTYEEWASAGIGNAFLFGKVMTSNRDLLLEFLQYSLPEFHILKIEDIRKEFEIRMSVDAHGVRLDIMAWDDQGRIIDVEMQLRNEKNIPKRMRYYGSAVDQTILERGRNYSELSEQVILFITPFDPFGDGLYRYTFRNICIENKDLELGDGTTKVLLNAAGRTGEIANELKGFLELVAGNQDAEEGTFAWRVQRQVVSARKNAKWRKEYMDWEMTLRNEWTKGHDAGLEEGRAKGRAEGTLEVLVSLAKEGLLTTREAAERAGITETEFQKKLEAFREEDKG